MPVCKTQVDLVKIKLLIGSIYQIVILRNNGCFNEKIKIVWEPSFATDSKTAS